MKRYISDPSVVLCVDGGDRGTPVAPGQCGGSGAGCWPPTHGPGPHGVMSVV